MRRLGVPAALSPLHPPRRSFLKTCCVRHGLEQVQDVPTSTDRRPRGPHRGPGKRQASLNEVSTYQFIKRWDLRMRENWDELEPFKGLPKPKQQFGNEATEIVWPYCALIERVVKVHPFTKSIYVYYSQRQSTEPGRRAARIARDFAREYLIPITFHNAQVYVETEMLLEFSETSWFVVHSLDGRHAVRPIVVDTEMSQREAVSRVLAEVVCCCDELGRGVSDPEEATRMLNERPPQNQYLRINYQWFGDTPEDRASHLVKWDFDVATVEPKLRTRTRFVLNWINHDGDLPTHESVRVNARRETLRMRKPHVIAGPKTFFNSSGARANARHGRFGGLPK